MPRPLSSVPGCAVALVALVALLASACADRSGSGGTADTARAPDGGAPAGDTSAGAARPAARDSGILRRGAPLFAGITLSAVQRTRIRLIQTKYADEMRSIQRRIAPQLRVLRAARRSGDTAAAQAAWERTARDRAELKAVGSKIRAEVREVLTPEQRPRFDANAAALERRAADLERRRGMARSGSRP
jgi:Spy/CpxP family protein refolding chaperone